ncbi:hypothetical protein GP2143_01570 [marine gamma proteobacterium HTCC2143]|jgi:hypothetical protein|uniref:Uncharacterized protein n=1 Tax=marine gamma proteobacterium HTCC2143 TaxID=247633 RepID=A0YFU1_9GAMM|nr:hypothetical protein GP2143_01570 [marine gamma proteobacterium HTCC2143]
MSIKFRNFRRLGAGYKTTPVPDDLKIKRASLYILEFGQFLVGGAICINASFSLFGEEGNNPVVYGPLSALGLLFIASAFSLATDLPWYRRTAVASILFSMVFSVFLIKKVFVLGVFAAILAVVLYILYLHPPNKEYYSWVKSLSR